VRPRIHYFFYRQRMFTRVPAGGPITGGTRIVITGEGINGAAATYDEINAMLVAENLLGSTIRRWYEIEIEMEVQIQIQIQIQIQSCSVRPFVAGTRSSAEILSGRDDL
jgi:hypothetical protein